MGEKKEKEKDKGVKASASVGSSPAVEGMAPKIIGELERVHMRQPKYDGMKVNK